MNDKIIHLQKLWRANRDLCRVLPLADVHRDCIGFAVESAADFTDRIRVATLLDVPAGHWAAKKRQTILGRIYELNLQGVQKYELAALSVGGPPQKDLNIDFGFFPISPEDSWLHSDFTGKYLAPRSGRVDKIEDSQYITYEVGGKPACKIAIRHRNAVRCIALTGDVVEQGQPLFLVTSRLRGQTFMASAAKTFDILNAGQFPAEFAAFSEMSSLMTQVAVANNPRWEQYREAFGGELESLLTAQAERRTLGPLGEEFAGEIQDILALEGKIDFPMVDDWAPQVLAVFDTEAATSAEIFTDEVLMKMGTSLVCDEDMWAVPWDEVPAEVEEYVSSYCFDTRLARNFVEYDGWYVCPPHQMDRWNQFSLYLGPHIVCDLRPQDRRFSEDHISEFKLQKQFEARRKNAEQRTNAGSK